MKAAPRSAPALFLEFPLLKREFIGLLRTRRAFWLLVLTVAVSILPPLLAWPGSDNAVNAAYRNRWTFLAFVLAQLIAALLVIPAFTAGAISGERERGSYELLYTTLLSPFSIVVSKALASVGYVSILLLASAPSMCVLFLLGGIDFNVLLSAYAATFAAVLSSAIVCLTVSMRSRRTAASAVRGVVWVVFWQFGLMMLYALALWLLFQGRTPLAGMLWVAYSLSPFPSLVALVGAGPGVPLGEMLGGYFTYAALLSGLHFAYLLYRAAKPDFERSPAGQRRRMRRGAGARTAGVRRSLFTRWLLKRELGNPVFEKEVRAEFFGRLWFRRLVFWVAFAVLFLVTCIENQVEVVLAPPLFIATAAILLLAPAIVSTSIPREIEQGNLDLLRGTLVPMERIARGKALAGLYSLLGVVGAAMVVLVVRLPVVPYDSKRDADLGVLGLAIAAVVLPLTLCFASGLGLLFGAISKRSVGAMVGAYAALAVIIALLPAILGGVFSVNYSLPDDFVAVGLNPFAVIGNAIFDFRGEGVASALAVFSAAYGGGGVLLCLLGEAAFKRLRERDR
jgi:ABC-type transport system involved in multi-copper enzyme maturation permease subunit